MNGVARCYCAGLALAALARLGVAVEKARREGPAREGSGVGVPCRGGSAPQKVPPLLLRCGHWLLPLVVDSAPRAATTFGSVIARTRHAAAADGRAGARARAPAVAHARGVLGRSQTFRSRDHVAEGCCGANGATTTNGRSQ